ncbi:MAG: glycoside hydrolase family 2 protein [Fimbriimonas sp.]
MSNTLPRPEYPRPDFVRDAWQNLNGIWEFAFDDANHGLREEWFQPGKHFDRTITVPYAYQTALSGIGDTSIHEVVWYGRDFVVPHEWTEDEDVLLHFGAVDYRCHVWLNGREVGHNAGGHVPFSFDVRPYLTDGINRLVLRVEDSQNGEQPRGKQSRTGIAHGIDYICTTGIWQTVWLERVPVMRLADVRIVPHLNGPGGEDALEITTYLHAPWGGYEVEIEVRYGDAVLARRRDACGRSVSHVYLPVPNAPRWTPDAPELLDVILRLWEGDGVLDEVRTYTGMRSVGTADGRMVLNGEPIYLRMVLDQGYWPESLLTGPTDEALRRDVELMKAMGFNGARKHQKVEDPRWLYWCDKLGLLVWDEMANAREWSLDAEEAFIAEWERVVRRDANHPCIVAWVPVNESWGVPKLEEHPAQLAFLERLVALTRRLDPTRPVVDNDGWEHTDVGDLAAIHDYTPDGEVLRQRWENGMPERTWGRGSLAHYVHGSKYRGQPIILSEVGGFLMLPEGKRIEEMDRLYTVYATHRTPEELLEKYEALMKGIAGLPAVAGYCYTQLTDIEPEINGLLTADRQPKVPLEALRAANEAVGR